MVFKMTGSTKQKALVLLGLVMIITAMIAASLPQLELQPGMPLPRLRDNQVVVVPLEAEPLVVISVNEFVEMLFILIVAGSMFYVAFMLLKGANWKDLTTIIRPILVISSIIVGFIFLILLLPKSTAPVTVDFPTPTPQPLVTSPLGPVPPLLLWLVGIGLLVAGILIGSWIFNSASNRATAIDVVGLEAEKAWQALKIGLDLKDVIIKCYRQMSLALEQERGLEREDFMTTREFENILGAAGVPHDPIHQLTQLFEAVRYGNWQPNPLDEQKALQCLEAIMQFSREAQRTD
jgi:hypothetical protein